MSKPDSSLDNAPKTYIDHDPILSRKSSGYGILEFFPPKASADKWDNLPWLMLTEKSPDGKGIKVKVQAAHVPILYKRPWLINQAPYNLPLD